MRRNVLLPIVVLLIAIVLYQPIQVLAEKKVESSVAQYVINEMGVFKNEQQIISSKDKEYCIKDKILYSKDMKQLIRVGDVTGKLILPSTIEKIAPYAFCYSNLSEIVLGKRVTQIASTAFCKTPKLKKLTVSSQNKKYCVKDGVLYSKDRKICVSSAAAHGSVYVSSKTKKILNGAFSYQQKMSSVAIAGKVTTLPQRCFKESSIVVIILPNTVTHIGNECFEGCSKLESVKLPKNVKKIGKRAFAQCLFHKLTIPQNVNYIGKDALYSGIEELVFKGQCPKTFNKQAELDDNGVGECEPDYEIQPGIAKVKVPRKYKKSYQNLEKKMNFLGKLLSN